MSSGLSQFAVQKAIYTALTGDAALMASISGVYDRVPEDANFPYVTIGDGNSRDWSTIASTGVELLIELHVYSRSGGRKEATQIMERLHTLLHQPSLTLEGHTLVMMRFDFSRVALEADGLTYHGLLRLRALTQSN